MRHLGVVVAVVVGATGVAAAQSSPPAQGTDKQRQQAGELVKKAIAKSQAGDHDTAIDLYLQAYAMIPTPILLSNVGSEYQLENKPVDALRYFCKYLDAEPTGANVGYATAQAKTLQIQLGNTAVDDKNVCKPKEAEKPKPQDEPKPKVTDPVKTDKVVSTVDEDHTEDKPTDGPRSTPSHTMEYAGLIGGGVGLLVFGLGGYYGLQAKRISDDITNHPPGVQWRPDIQAYEQEGKDDQTKQIAFMIAGGAVAVGGVVVFLIARSHRTGEHVTVIPTSSRSSVGVALSGSF